MVLSEMEYEDYLGQLEFLLEGSPEGQDASLREIFRRLEAFVETGDIEPAELTVRLLGTAVGGQKTWQTPYRESGILSFALHQLLDVDTASDLNKQYLRVIGNCVADNDTNREIVTRELAKLVACISLDGLTIIALIVLFNLCNDFDPAKAASAALRLDVIIAENLALDRIPEAALDYAVDLLTWTTEKLTDVQLKDSISLSAFKHLLRVALKFDEDHFHEYVAVLVHYLQDPEFQQKAATPELLDNIVGLMLDFETRITHEESEAIFKELSVTGRDEMVPSDQMTVLLLAQLVNSISAISVTDAFVQAFSIRSPVVERIRAKIRAPADSPFAVCACVLLGNLAMSDAVCIDMVNIMELHVQLIEILSSSNHSALLYAAAGCMRHLTFPEANRSILADAGLLQTCCCLLELSDTPVRGEAAAMLCKLITNSFHNIETVVYGKVGEENRRVPETERLLSADSTILTHIVEQALVPSAPLPSTAMKNPMIELGRTIIAMLRHLGRPNAEKDVDAVRQEMFKISAIGRPVARLVRQRFYADARSEALLGLGLMAQSPEGASRVIVEIQEDGGLLDAIKEFAIGDEGGAGQQGTAAGRDYQNAMVLLQALQNNAGGEMHATLKDQVVSLQEELGRLMM